MAKFLKSFILILTFLTRIPIPMNFEFDQEDFSRGFKLFPVVGIMVGFIISIPYWFKEFMPVSVTVFMTIILYLLTVGGLHIDGVSDVFDGVFSARKPERMLAFMEDSRIGAFGAIGLIVYFLGLVLGLYEVYQLNLQVAGLPLTLIILVLMPLVGRTMALVVAGFSTYAKESGMGRSLVEDNTASWSLIWMISLLIVGIVIDLWMMMVMVIMMMIILFINYRIHKILGGITGDVVGMVLELSQVVFLLVCVVVFYNF